jgi:LysR family transcriptional regulator, glycine cleavage system transcriptional activator
MVLDMPKLPPLSAIRAFEAAARHRSFTRAAEELGMSQAAVSYQIRVLEERVGAPLFVRLPRHVELTALGERLGAGVTAAFEKLRATFASTAKAVDNVISLSVLPTIASHWLVPRLGRFQMAHPQYAVQLDASHDVVDFRREGFDIGIRSGGGDWPDLEAHVLLPSHFTPLCSPSLLEGRDVGAPGDLLELPLLGRHDPWWERWFMESGVGAVDLSDRPDNSLGTQHFEGLAAAAGQGVALLNPFFFAAELADGRLVQLFDRVLKGEKDYWLVYPKTMRRSPKIRAFRDWALAEAGRDSTQAAANEESRRADRSLAGAATGP